MQKYLNFCKWGDQALPMDTFYLLDTCKYTICYNVVE